MRKATLAALAAMLVILVAGCNGPADTEETTEATVEETTEVASAPTGAGDLPKELPPTPGNEEEARNTLNSSLPPGAPQLDPGEDFEAWRTEFKAWLEQKNAAQLESLNEQKAKSQAAIDEMKANR